MSEENKTCVIDGKEYLLSDVEAMGFEMNDTMMSMLGSFTILRLLGMAGGMLGIEISKEELLELNAKLNKIKAPKKK